MIASLLTAASLEENPPVRRPFEAELASVTLWPEVEKVFGHGYEASPLCALSLLKSSPLHSR
jgi:hypothetical protein